MGLLDKRTKRNVVIILITGAAFCLWMALYLKPRLDKEMRFRNDLTEKIIDIHPIPDVNIPHSQHSNEWEEGFKFEYRSVQDAIAGRNVDNVYNIEIPDYGPWNAADMETGREHIKRRSAREKQLSVKPNPDYVADGVTAVLEIYIAGHNRIRNEYGYILVNDKKELKAIEDNIQSIGTIVVLMRYNANSQSYKSSGSNTRIALNQEGMSVYFYDCKNGVVFDNFTILAGELPEKFKNVSNSTTVLNHVEIINSKLKTNLSGHLSFDEILW